MRHQEEVKGTVNNLRLLNETVIDVRALRRVSDGRVATALSVSAVTLLATELEESLTHALVHNDQSRLRELNLSLLLAGKSVLLLHNLVQLLQLVLNDLATHGVADTVAIDEDVIRKRAGVVVTEGLERVLEVLLQDAGTDDLLTLLALRTGLRVVLAHVLVVGGTETDDRLLSLVAHIDADQHRLLRDLGTEVKAPQVAAKLGVDLAQYIDVDAIVILLDGLRADELGDDWRVRIDLVLERSVQVLLLDRVRHDDQEEIEILRLLGLFQLPALGVLAANVLRVVVVDGFLESFNA